MTSEEHEPADALSRRWQPALRAFFMRRLRDPASADDLTQEVLIKLLQQPEQRGDSYVFQIAQNLLIDQQRRAAVRDRHLRTALTDEQRDRNPIDAHTILEGQQQLGLAAAVLAALPDRTRQIFILYRFEKMSQHDVGLAFGISASAVKQQVAKAMAALARALRDDR